MHKILCPACGGLVKRVQNEVLHIHRKCAVKYEREFSALLYESKVYRHTGINPIYSDSPKISPYVLRMVTKAAFQGGCSHYIDLTMRSNIMSRINLIIFYQQSNDYEILDLLILLRQTNLHIYYDGVILKCKALLPINGLWITVLQQIQSFQRPPL